MKTKHWIFISALFLIMGISFRVIYTYEKVENQKIETQLKILETPQERQIRVEKELQQTNETAVKNQESFFEMTNKKPINTDKGRTEVLKENIIPFSLLYVGFLLFLVFLVYTSIKEYKKSKKENDSFNWGTLITIILLSIVSLGIIQEILIWILA
ncbi:hypothetical protein HX049_18215 [Myroides odoratimimus]|uniref:hypothetical protein n=1 Tax=Myroides odoratimimus TaxID=76832 RepID=UPI002578E43B|nr:hypothetical protein [Myroides odoratimimus]MDM1399061.1 hypothetical protein [Myroides odoratimimus]